MSAETPADALAAGADAIRQLLACHVPAVDWLHGDEHAARRSFNSRMIAEWTRLLGAAHRVQTTWMAASAIETRRRTRLDTMRGLALTMLRAWREVADRVPARAAKWEHRWTQACRDGHGCALARQLHNMTRTPPPMVRMLLTYQRLVAAPSVHARRVAHA